MTIWSAVTFWVYLFILIIYNQAAFQINENTVKKRIAISVVVIIVLVCSFHCRKKTQIRGLFLEFSFPEEKLSDNLITDMKFTWRTDKEFEGISQDFEVFVLIWHGNNLLHQDYHFPEVPTSKWLPEKDYVFTRKIYIPPFIDKFDSDFRDEETLKFEVGFYSPSSKDGESKRDILIKKFKVFPTPFDIPEIIFQDGWYDEEVNPTGFLKKWRWTGEKARCIVDNPHRDALLVIKGGTEKDVIPNQTVIFKINEAILDEFIPAESHFEKYYDIKRELLGDGDDIILTIETNETFIPAKVIPRSDDQRQLGIKISFLYFR